MRVKNILGFILLCGFFLSSWAQTYRVGDLYTAPDGSLGIVYYLQPDGNSGWVVALDDACPTACPWGEMGDIPTLGNVYGSYYTNLLNDTAGYSHTEILRTYQNNNNDYAASKVDFNNGWVLPSIGQLRRLYGQLPFISSALINAGGTVPLSANYWSSTEYIAEQAWKLNFVESDWYSGGMNYANKTDSCRVRAVRSFSNLPTYHWSTGDTTATITVAPTQTTEYTVTVTSPTGYTGTALKTVAIEAPTPNSTPVFLCSDSTATLTAREAVSYLWNTDETTRNITISEAGIYTVTATPSGDCAVVDTFKVTSVKVNSISGIHIPEICAGDNAVITVGHDDACNVTFATHETILALNDTVFLPDGRPCGQYGCSYRSPLTFAGYEDTAHVNSVNDIRYVRINLEHSWSGDIYINLTCPNGQKADILKYGNSMDNGAPCKQDISLSSREWASPNNNNATPYTFFGLANDSWAGGNSACDKSNAYNAPGIGWNYCWSNNTSEGYTYSGGDGLIYRNWNVIMAYNPFMLDEWDVFDSSDVTNGTQFYHPDESFNSLIGCPLNGSWYIEVIDGNNVDNGYIFGWELALAEDIQTVEYADVTFTTVDGPWVTVLSDSSFLLSPPADLPHDTVIAYTFHCHSAFGCGYDTVVNIPFYARSLVTIDTTSCDDLVWNGVTYTADTTFTDSLTSIHGCDSLVTVNIHVITTPSVTISGPEFFCADSSVTLTAIATDEAQSYLWSNGEATPSITVTEPGIYTVTAYFAGGCNAESPDFHLFVSEDPIIEAHLSDMVAGDTQTVVISTAAASDPNLLYANPQSTLTYSNVTFLPDGVPCEPLGCSYRANLSFSGFPDSAVIQSAEDIRYVRLNMEHSFIHDLYINLTCPNGQRSDILKLYNRNNNCPCLESISNSQIGWRDNDNIMLPQSLMYPHYPTYFGWADWRSDNNDRCDSTLSDNTPGTGWNYCWSNNTTEGYQYAPGEGSLVYRPDNVNYHLINYIDAFVVDSSNVSEGSQFYHPDVSFDSLVGCPLNGTWYIEVLDGKERDNGYIFEAELSVAEHLAGSHYLPLVQTGFDSLWVTRTGDTTFTITPPHDLPHDTTVNYTFTLVDENGCTFDTTLTITVYAHKHVDLYDTVYVSELPHVWEGLTFNCADCQDTLLHTVHGADSIVTLHLSVIYPHDTIACENDLPVNWRNHTFTGADSVAIAYPTGCADSIEVLVLRVSPITYSDTSAEICGSFTWHGQLYTKTPTVAPTFTITNAAGCDSVVTLHLTIHPTYNTPLSQAICQGESYVFFDQELNEAGVYTHLLQTVDDCDSMLTLTLTVNPLPNVVIAGDSCFCQGDSIMLTASGANSYVWNNSLIAAAITVNEAGTYTVTGTDANGCTNADTVTISVNPTYNTPLTHSICQGDTFNFYGQELVTEGTYTHTLQAQNGCDSVLTLTLTVNPLPDVAISGDNSFCQGESIMLSASGANSYAWSNASTSATITVNEAGIYTVTGTNANNCENTATVTVFVNPTYNTPLTHSICQGDIYNFYGLELSTEGIYTHTLQSVSGCDSVLSLTLTVNPLPNVTISGASTICQDASGELTASGADTYVWSTSSVDTAITVSTEGVYSVVGTDTNGCEKTASVTVNVTQIYNTPLAHSICQGDNYNFYGQELTTEGIYTHTLQSASGCDSVITLTLTVNPLPDVAISGSSSLCQGDTLTVSGAETYEWSDGSAEDFLEMSESGIYSVTGTDAYGCTNADTVTVSVNPIYNTPVTHSICQGDTFNFHGTALSTEGTYTHTLQSVNGCDSVITLTLTVHPLPNVTISGNNSICQGDSIVLTASGAITYTWSNLSTNTNITVSNTGVYTVVGIDINGCENTAEVSVIVHQTLYTPIQRTICEGSSFEFHGEMLTTEGIYYDTVSSAVGCDSIIQLTLSVGQIAVGDTFAVACDTFTWRGVTYYETPETAPSDTLIGGSLSGCDSVTMLHLTIHHSTSREDTVSICEGELPYSYGDTLFLEGTLSGEYVLHDTTVFGCDSTVTLHLDVIPNIHTTTPTFIICESMLPTQWHVPGLSHYIPAGTTGDTIIVDTFHLASNGCDSIVTRKLTIGPSTDTLIVDTVVQNQLPYTLNGKQFGTSGIYHDTTMNIAGCDSIITIDLTVYYNVQVELFDTLCSNQLPFVWHGMTFNSENTQIGDNTHSVTIPTVHGADSVIVMHLRVKASPTAHISGPPVFCADNFATLFADTVENCTYLWSTGDTTQSIQANATGLYSVTVTNEYGCTASATHQLFESILVMPIDTMQFPDLCAGEAYPITVGHQTSSSIVLDNPISTLSWADTVFLPDGIPCGNPPSCSYRSPLTFTDFEPGATVSSVNDILYVRVNMEHSYAGDLYINITCPNGQKADILKFGGDSWASSNCLSQIPSTSKNWQGPTYSNAGKSTFFGMAYDFSSNTANACNANHPNNAPGDGWNYCWSNNNDQGYIYAGGQGSLIYRSVNAHTANGSGSQRIFDSSNVAAGTQFYHPDQSFQSLVGCPLNGPWYIEVMDGWSTDNGYLFGWELALAPHLVPNPYSDVTFVTVDGPWVTSVSDSAFIFSPPADLAHDTVVVYTFHLEDQYGCGYDTTVALNVYAQSHTRIDTTVCDSFSWDNVTYTESGQYNHTFANVHGCDSTVIVNFTINHAPEIQISGTSRLCADSAAVLSVSYNGEQPLHFLWSTEDTTAAIGISSAGDYSVTATDTNGCSGTATHAVTTPQNPIVSIDVPGFCVGGTYAISMGTQASQNIVLSQNPALFTADWQGLWASVNDGNFIVTPSPDLSHDTTVTYSLALLDADGCPFDTTLDITFHPLNHTTVEDTACDNYLWNGTTYTQTGIYQVTLPNVFGCDSSVTLSLTVNHSTTTHDTLTLLQNQLPYYFAPNDTTFGTNSPAEFQFSYTLPTQQGCDSIVQQKVFVYQNVSQIFDTTVCASTLPFVWHGHTFTTTSTYTDTLHTVHGSDSVLTYNVTVDAIDVTIDNVGHILCFGEATGTATATVTGGIAPIQYQWTNNNNPVASTSAISNRPEGTYSVLVTDAEGCTATNMATINTLHGEMVPGTISGLQSVCYGDTIGEIAGTAAVGDNDCSYQWQISMDGAVWNPAAGTNNTQNYTFTEGSTETFSLRRAWISVSCGTLYSDTLLVTVWPTFRDTLYDNTCLGSTYQGNGFDIPETETTVPGIHFFTKSYTSIHGCDSLVVLQLNIHEPQEVTIDATICEGESYNENGFDIPATETIGFDTLQRTLSFLTTFDCDSTVHLNLNIIDTAVSIISLTEDFCESMSAELQVVTQMTDYLWSTGEQMPNITVTLPGTYYVTASQGGCSVTARYFIESCDFQLYLPNAITPSRNDGLNDVFCIPEMTQRMINDFEISVFNRWGEMVFYSTNKDFKWNGEVKGKVFYNIVYNYVIRYTDANGKPYRVTGSITVL